MGDNENIPLELIVRTGDEALFSRFVSQNRVPQSTRTEKYIETLIYSALRNKGEFKGDMPFHRYFAKMFKLLNMGKVRKYFASTNNVPLLKELVDRLKDGADNYVDHTRNKQEGVLVVDLLRIKEFSGALRRNMYNGDELGESAKEYVQASYCAVFSPANSKLAQNIDHYLAILQPWQLHVDIFEVADEVIDRFVELDNSILSKKNYPNFCATINKLINLTDRSTISRLVAVAYGEIGRFEDRLRREHVYNKIVQDGVVDKYEYKQTAEDIGKDIRSCATNVRQNPKGAGKYIRELVSRHGKERIALGLVQYFEYGNLDCRELFQLGSKLYDVAIAKRHITASIEKAIYQKDWEKLDFAVEVLPKNLIDAENPVIKTAILPAYRVIHKGN